MVRYTNQRGRYNKGGSKRMSKRRYSSKYPTVKSVDRKIKKIQRDQELRYLDVQQLNTLIPVAGSATLLNGITPGDSQTNRQGNRVTMTSINYRGAFLADADQLAPTFIRMIIFYDKSANSSLPVTNVFDPSVQSLLNGNVITDPIYMPYSRENSMRYKILKDKIFTINPILGQTNTATNLSQVVPVGRYFQGKIKLSRQAFFDSAAPTIAGFSSNSLFVVFYSDVNTAANQPQYDFASRLYFKE